MAQTLLHPGGEQAPGPPQQRRAAAPHGHPLPGETSTLVPPPALLPPSWEGDTDLSPCVREGPICVTNPPTPPHSEAGKGSQSPRPPILGELAGRGHQRDTVAPRPPPQEQLHLGGKKGKRGKNVNGHRTSQRTGQTGLAKQQPARSAEWVWQIPAPIPADSSTRRSQHRSQH